ncbi:uncharacterized protein LOC131594147 [Vicia villosa]|uniref:uncharacterized protein LOC131594147 n=1 Tax=Vicia villosa TaxID=3911 RepID=UPI00273B85DE|nr:uncharacterized protein LOC131594147 [Vicia villosa]
MDVEKVDSSTQHIHCRIFNAQGVFQYWLSIIYAHNQLPLRNLQWKTLQEYGQREPWMILGDFNNVMKVGDRIGGHPVQSHEYTALEDMMPGSLSSKIVKEFLNAYISDHTPIRVQQKENEDRKQGIYREFKFLNCITENPHIGDTDLKAITYHITDGVKNIQNARLNLAQAENMLAADLFNQDHFDEEKNKKAGIQQLEDRNGRMLTEHKDIEAEVVNFYKGLVGTASSRLKHVDIVALRDGNQLNEEDRQQMIQPVSTKEIWEALQGVGDNKAPGGDVTYRYLINGKPSPSIQAKRGLRQGDPISPILFVLIMKYLHRSLRKLKHMPAFKFHPKCKKSGITNICFADDLMMFTRGDPVSVQIMMREFHLVSEATGLMASPTKCKVCSRGINATVQQQILQITDFSASEIPFKYLGVPMSCRKLNIHQCRPLVDRILHKGNADMTRKAPVAWDTVCNPRVLGGLNITSLKEWNIATMGKLFWNIQAKADKLWVKWISAYYLKCHSAMDWQYKNCSWLLANIFKCRDKVKDTGMATRKTVVYSRK